MSFKTFGRRNLSRKPAETVRHCASLGDELQLPPPCSLSFFESRRFSHLAARNLAVISYWLSAEAFRAILSTTNGGGRE